MNNKISKSLNLLRGTYRTERKSVSGETWSVMFQPKNVIDHLVNNDFKSGAFEHKMKPYKLYFFRSLLWHSWKLISHEKVKKTISLFYKVIFYSGTVALSIVGLYQLYSLINRTQQQEQKEGYKQINKITPSNSYIDSKAKDSLFFKKTDSLNNKDLKINK